MDIVGLVKSYIQKVQSTRSGGRKLTSGEIAMARKVYKDKIPYSNVVIYDTPLVSKSELRALAGTPPKNVPATQWRLVLWVVGKLGGIAAGGQGDTISDNVITPMGRAFFTGNSYRPDFSSDSYLSQELLIHELGHCWQYYNGIDVVKRVIASYSSVSPEGFGDSSGEGGALGSDNVNDATYVIKLNATNTAGARALVDNFGIEQQGTVFEAYYRYHILNRPDRVSNDHSSVINVPRIQLLVEDAMK